MNPHTTSDVSCQCCASHVRDEFRSMDEEQAVNLDLLNPRGTMPLMGDIWFRISQMDQ